jgi:hypothetical protein
MEIKIDKSQVMRVSRINEALHIKVENRELKDVYYFYHSRHAKKNAAGGWKQTGGFTQGTSNMLI